MKDIHHQNVNTFIGACVNPGQICILTHYCNKGSLQVKRIFDAVSLCNRENQLAFCQNIDSSDRKAWPRTIEVEALEAFQWNTYSTSSVENVMTPGKCHYQTPTAATAPGQLKKPAKTATGATDHFQPCDSAWLKRLSITPS